MGKDTFLLGANIYPKGMIFSRLGEDGQMHLTEEFVEHVRAQGFDELGIFNDWQLYTGRWASND